MLQRVAAHDVAGGENGFVGGFENLGESVESERDAQVRRPRIARRKKHDEQQHDEKGTELRESVGAQIFVAARLRDVPIDHAGCAEDDERNEQPDSELHADALSQRRRHKGNEADCHGNAVPNEGVIVRVEVVITRAESRERDANEKHEIWPALARFYKGSDPSHSTMQDEPNPQQTHE